MRKSGRSVPDIVPRGPAVAWVLRTHAEEISRAPRGCGAPTLRLASAGGCSAGLYARRPLAAAPARMLATCRSRQKGSRNLFPEGPGGCYAEKVPGTFLPRRYGQAAGNRPMPGIVATTTITPGRFSALTPGPDRLYSPFRAAARRAADWGAAIAGATLLFAEACFPGRRRMLSQAKVWHPPSRHEPRSRGEASLGPGQRALE